MIKFVVVVAALIAVAAAQNDCEARGFFAAGGPETPCDEQCYASVSYTTTIFATSYCPAEPNLPGGCYSCIQHLRMWTTVFIFVVFAAAVAILALILPLCITNCIACVTVRKEAKQKKKVNSSMNTMEVAKVQQQPQYNPYAYWPYYGRN